MLDFYNEISKYKKQPEFKKLRKSIDKEKSDFIEIAIAMLKNGDRRVK